MKNQYLSEVQLEQVSAVLKKYGIESDDLLDELADHYARLIEERMESGKTFDEAFGKFVSENSWLKLRKLQHAHWKYSEKSLLKFIWRSLQSLYSFPKLFIPISAAVLLYYILNFDTTWSRMLLVGAHIGLILQTLALFIIAFVKYRNHKIMDIGYVAQVSLSVFYAMIISTWSDTWNVFNPWMPSEVGIYVQLGYYLLIAHLAYLHYCVYQRGTAKINQKKILG
jgi:hypothetical protein